MRASGGASSGSFTCGGAAGTVYILNGTSTNLIFDNSGGTSASSTLTPFPPDLNGVLLSQLNISGKAYVDLRQSKLNNDVRASVLDLDQNSKITGDSVVIDTSNATIRGQILATAAAWLHNAQSGPGRVTAFSGSSITCTSGMLKMSLTGSTVALHGSISATNAEVKGLRNFSHTGTLIVSGSYLSIMVETAMISGVVRCTGAACSSLVSVNETLQLGGSLDCTNDKCALSVRSGGDMTATGTISCSGNGEIRTSGKISVLGTIRCISALCPLELEGGQIEVGKFGNVQGGDVIMKSEKIAVQGSISTTGQGHTEQAGSGKGSRPLSSWTTSYDEWRVAGSGAGHGGDGADGCYQYSSSYGSKPSGTLGLCISMPVHMDKEGGCSRWCWI